MTKVKILSDSACDLPDTECARLGVDLVSLSVRFGNDEFTDRVTITTDEFWELCLTQRVLPETAAPSPGAFLTAFAKAVEEGASAVIVVTLSSKLSGTFQSAKIAADAFQGIPVFVLDSEAVSMGQGVIVAALAEEALAGRSFDELVTLGQVLVTKTGVVAMLDTLDHLIKGGRVGGAKAFIGQMLSIKPLIRLRDGEVSEAGRQRTVSKALRHIADEVKARGSLDRIAVIHANSPHVAALTELVAGISVNHPLIVASIGPTVGTHGGPGAIGIAWLETYDELR
jgi:DegV family protein with EDD domain